MSEPIDLGHGVTLRWVSWAPDRALNPQYDGIPDVERYGAFLDHPRAGAGPWADDGVCTGYIEFDGEVQRRIPRTNRPRWTVESWEPLTISPSVLCSCGHHGFIRGGLWVPA